MFNIALFQPEIPPNTGNIIRLCANASSNLHLIEPLGFLLDDKHLRRAGLDYTLKNPLKRYPNFNDFKQFLESTNSTLYLCSTKAKTCYASLSFNPGDTFLFGPETRGLPVEILNEYPDSRKIFIPMAADSRSINLSNAVAIILYEAWRQQHFGKPIASHP